MTDLAEGSSAASHPAGAWDGAPALHDRVAVEVAVAQRVRALEAFLADVYGPGRAMADGVVPRRVVTSSRHFHRAAAGIEPPNGVRVHVARVDLVRDAEGRLHVLADHLRVLPSTGPVPAATARPQPGALDQQLARPDSAHPRRLLAALRATAPAGVEDPVVVVLTAGVDDSAHLEHARLARAMGVELVEGADLLCHGGQVHLRTTAGLWPVHVVHRQVDDDVLDPLHVRSGSGSGSGSVLGCAGLLNAARAGGVTIANAVGNGVAQDARVRPYLPALVRYYLGEEPLIDAAPTGVGATPTPQPGVLRAVAVHDGSRVWVTSC